MKVSFRQSGGFAGLIRGVDLDTTKLDAAQAGQLEQLVAASGLQGTTSARSQVARDLVQYEISIEQNHQISKASFDDKTVPAAAAPLLTYLKSQARPMPLDSAKR